MLYSSAPHRARLTVCFCTSWNAVNSKPGSALNFSKALQQLIEEYSVASSKVFFCCFPSKQFFMVCWVKSY